MIKKIIDYMNEQKQKRDRLSKMYYCDHIIWGYYNKNVSEDGFDYTYKHCEAFFVDSATHPVDVKRLTGEKCDDKILTAIKCKRSDSNKDIYKVQDNDVLYELNTCKQTIDENYRCSLGKILEIRDYTNWQNSIDVLRKIRKDKSIIEEFYK